MFKGFNNRQLHGFPNLSFAGDKSAYGQGSCSFWLRSDFGLNTQTNLGAVSSWVDSVNGYRFIENTAGNQPRLLTSSLSYNSLPVVEFQDTARRLVSPEGVQSRTIVFVANYDLLTIRNTVIQNVLNGNTIINVGGSATNINGVSIEFQGGGIRISGTTENTNVKIGVITQNMIMVNGVVENSSTFDIDSTMSAIGPIQGKIAEVIGYTVPLTQTQALAISTQLNQKYVIY
jgi:hypothetical protein